MDEATELKQCRKCGELKPRSQFYHHPKAKDSLQTWCIACYKKLGENKRQRIWVLTDEIERLKAEVKELSYCECGARLSPGRCTSSCDDDE